MGCLCCREPKADPGHQKANLEEYHIQSGSTNINVKISTLAHSPQSTIISVINNKANSFDLNKQFPKLQEAIKKALPQQSLQFADILQIQLENHLFLLIVLPLWVDGSKNEFQLFKQAIESLMQLIIQFKTESITIQDLAVPYFGYPRQLIIPHLVSSFKTILPSTQLKQIDYVSTDVDSKLEFEKYTNEIVHQNRASSFEQEQKEHYSKPDDLKSPLLQK